MEREDLDPPIAAVRAAVIGALAEDTLPMGDITAGLLDASRDARAAFVARKAGVIAGTACAREVMFQVDTRLEFTIVVEDGEKIPAGATIATVAGPYSSLVTAERSALNFLCHLSGVATMTRHYVDLARAANPAVRIADTRKTTPGLRSIEKAAVRSGGGVNHRGNLSEGILLKDNHLGGLPISLAVQRAVERWPGRMIEVECDQIEQVQQAIDAGATIVMCDNMTPDEVAQAVKLVRSHPRGEAHAVIVEASGGVSIENVADYAKAGPDIISVGAITHSAPALDIGLDLSA